MHLKLDDQFNQQLPADPIVSATRRPIEKAAFSFVQPRVPSAPKLLHASTEVGDLIGISPDEIQSEDFLNVFSGAVPQEGMTPYSMCYGGHQFGHWAGQLGDGRAIVLGEVVHDNHRFMLQLKGAGETPYSRTADGLAVLRSSLREHLCSEAMFHLGVATTRSLCLIQTGDQVMRDMMYDGNAAFEPGAVVCRVAPSFIRFGSFQIFAVRGDVENLRRLTEYTIRQHFPAVAVEGELNREHYVQFFQQVCQRTLAMVIDWQRVGFVHGVMNTDNMSIHGETIDFGPYGWLEGYDHQWTPNTTDRQHQRYRYGNQPQIALWNLLQLANALYPLINDAAPLEQALKEFQSQFEIDFHRMMGQKIGLSETVAEDYQMLAGLQENLQLVETDMTLFFRNLAKVKLSQLSSDLGSDTSSDKINFLDPIMDAFYAPDEIKPDLIQKWHRWFTWYAARVDQNESDHKRAERMNRVNPKYVLRNYMAQLAIDQAEKGDPSLISELHELLKRPYDEQPEKETWFAKRPEWARYKVGCSMLSCSS